MNTTRSYIKVRTQFEGFHCYPGAGDIDPRIKFLEDRHRHMFHVEVKVSVTHDDRELEFFLVKWAIESHIKRCEMDNMSCEMIARDLLDNVMIPMFGERYYEIVVSEDGESDGIIEYFPENK
jgi:hypothetical protein